LSGARVWENGTKEKKHQAYFANKINIYEDKNSCEISQKEKKRREIQAHTHTQIYEMRIEEREKKKRETGITVIRTVSSAYVE
jgi:hypothetical protein